MKRFLLFFLCLLLMTAALSTAWARDQGAMVYAPGEPVSWRGYTWTPLLFTNDYDLIAQEMGEPMPSFGVLWLLRLERLTSRGISKQDVLSSYDGLTLQTADGAEVAPQKVIFAGEDGSVFDLLYYFEYYYTADELFLRCEGTLYALDGLPDRGESLVTPVPTPTPTPEPALSAALKDQLQRFRDTEPSAVDEVPDMPGKLFVAVFDKSMEVEETSANAGAAGEDFHGIPAASLASDYDSADTVIIIYRTTRNVGYYTTGGAALRTVTRMAVFKGGKGTLYNAAINEPPSTIYGSIGSGGAGAYEPETALALIAEQAQVQLRATPTPSPTPTPTPKPTPTPVQGDKSLYDKGILLLKDERYYSAQQAFIESEYGNWDIVAEACVQKWPATGEIWHNSSVSGSSVKLTVKVNAASDTAYFLRIYKAGGTPVSYLFIGGTGQVTVRLPAGSYMMKDGSGTTWYGEKEAFGRYGSYETMTFDSAGSETVRLENGGDYTLTINVKEADPNADRVGSEYESWEDFID